MKKTLICLSLLFFTVPSFAGDVELLWDKNTENDLAGYKIYYDTDSGPPYDGAYMDQGNSPIIIFLEDLENKDEPSYKITGLDEKDLHFFTVTAFDKEVPSLESDYSNEVVLSNGAPEKVNGIKAMWLRFKAWLNRITLLRIG